MYNIYDGELVMDRKWREDKANVAPIFLIFDALVVNTKNVIADDFSSRLVAAHQYV